MKVSRDHVPAGSEVKVAVMLAIEPGWHINSHTPTYDYLIGTTLNLQPVEGIIVSDLQYPNGALLKFGFADDPLSVYEGTVPVFLTLRISGKLQAGLYPIGGSLRVQACNDEVCLAPSTIPLEIPLTVAAGGKASQEQHDEVFKSYTGQQSSIPQEDASLVAVFDREGSLVAFAAIFLVGLALNLTPCVYPMVSVTVSLFGTQSDTNTLRVFGKAAVYILGIATMYSTLGVTAALSGELFGNWLQSPWVLAFIGALLFALALSMFGAYQLQAPYWLTSRLGGTTGTGLVSLFLSGLVVGVFAAPCIGPPVIALLAYVGQKGDPVFGFWSFFVLSLGLGFPYLILGTFSGLLNKVPKSGAWLVWVERLFGVVLTGAALFYFSLAVVPAWAVFVVPLTFIGGGIYLGFLESSANVRPRLRRLKWVFGAACILVGTMFANALREPGVTWETYSPEFVAQAQESGKPVMIDFYADWCIPCLELDRRTFTDEEVIRAAESFVRLKVDLTHFDSPEAEALRKQFDIAGVPTIVFLNANGIEERGARVLGFLPPKEFLERMTITSGALSGGP
ncbi:MAG: thioredoxin family protein [Ignavibacteriales bacterium]|nr:thioredoxin family protein [Ignavibacteriales bacterium]